MTTSRASARFNQSPWPNPLGEAARYGLAGEFVQILEPHTEADPAALLLQFLVQVGNLIGRGPHFLAEADQHFPNLFLTLVGVTAKGRKGSAEGHVRRLLQSLDPAWATHRIMSGLSSGEGLIHAVRDPRLRVVHGAVEVEDEGVSDKRLLIVEPEFGSVQRVLRREGNTLSPILRQAWDSGILRVLTKHSPNVATNAHISLVAHVTKTELLKHFDSVEAAGGLANRFLWASVQRSKVLPEGGRLSSLDWESFTRRLSDVVTFAGSLGTTAINRDADARHLWYHVYGDLSEGRPGLLGAVTSRAEAQVMRLALIYALLDQSSEICLHHLFAALEVWRFCFDSARYIFGDASGDPVADGILRALRDRPDGMTRSELRELFGHHRRAEEIERGLTTLAELGLARFERELTTGRPAERWHAVARRPAGSAESPETPTTVPG